MKVRKNVNRFLAFLLALVLMFTTFTSDIMTVNAQGHDVSSDNVTVEEVAESVVDETDAVDDVTGDDLISESGAEVISEEEALATEENEFKNIEDENTQDISYPEVYFDPVTVRDTTITIYAPEGAFPEGVFVEVSDATEEIDNSFEGEDFFAVDISFFDKNNNKIEPLCDISVSIESASLVTESVDIYHVDEISNEIEFVETAIVEDGAIEFVNDDFSVYVIKKNGDGIRFYFTNDEGLPCAYIFGKNNNVDTSKESFDNWNRLESDPFYPISGDLGYDHERNIKMYTHDNGFNGGNSSLIIKYEILKKGSTDEVEYTFTDENLCLYYYSQSRYYKKVKKLEYSQKSNGRGILTATLYDNTTRDYNENFSKFCWIVDDAVSEKIVTYQDPTDSFEKIEVPVSSNDANEYKLAACPETWEKTGYTFGGWVCSADKKVYEAGVSYPVNDEVTFTAKWVANTYNVHVDSNGGIPVNGYDFKVTYGQQYINGNVHISSNINYFTAFQRKGYTYLGAFYNGESLTRTSAVNVASDHTVVIEWEAKKCNLTYKLDDTKNSPSYDGGQVTYDAKATLAAADDVANVFNKEGYALIGWSKKANQETVDFELGAEVNLNDIFNENGITLYPVFKKTIKDTLTVSAESATRYYLEKDYAVTPADLQVVVKDGEEVVEADSVNLYAEEECITLFTAKSEPGSYDIYVKAVKNGYTDAVCKTSLSIEYYVPTEMPEGKLEVADKNTIDGLDWYGNFSGNELTLSFEGYKVSKLGNEKGYFESVNISADEGPHSYDVTLMKLDDEGKDLGIVGTSEYEGPLHAKKEYAVDTTAPTTNIFFGRSRAKKVLNTLSFGFFFKDSVKVTIDADDKNGVGISSVMYTKSDALVTDYDSLNNWVDYTEAFDVNAEFKGLVYAKVTDKVGNETIVYTDGVVVYKAVNGITESVKYTKTTNADVEISGEAFGNTVKSVVVTRDNRNYVVGYSAPQYDSKDNNTFVLSLNHEDLEKLNVGDYNVAITFNCLDVDGRNNNQVVNVKLTVAKAGTEAALNIDKNEWVFDQFDKSVNTISVSAKDTANEEYRVDSPYKLYCTKKDANSFTEISIDKLNKLVPGEYTLKVVYKETDKFEASEATQNFTVKTPEVYFYLRSNNTWTEIDHVEAGKLSAELFDEAFKDGAVGKIENNAWSYNASTLADKYFANISDTIADLKANGYDVSFHKIGLFDKSNNDVNHADSSKHFHVDFDLSKITDQNVSVTMDGWTYGDEGNTPVAKQNPTEPNSDTKKRGGEQKVTFYYTGILRGEPGAAYASKEVPSQAGTYTVTATFAANDYYNETKASADFTIAPAIVEVDWKLDNESKNTVEYDGKTHHVYGVVTNECYKGEEFFVNPIWYENDKTDAGSYTSNAWAVADFRGKITYNYDYNDDEKFEWTITQKEVNIVWPKNNNFTYNGYPQGYNMYGTEQIGLTGVLARDNGQVAPTFTKDSVLNATNAGNYYIEATGLEGGRASNYKLGGFSEKQKWVPTGWFWGHYETVKEVPSFDWTIEQLEAKLAWSGDDGLVNGPGTHYRAADRNGLVLYYSEHPYTVTAKVTNIQARDTVNVIEYSQDRYYWHSEPSNVKTNVGNYNAVATKLDNDNYKLPANAAQKWSIEYYPDLEKVNAVFTEAPNSYGWYNKSVTLTGPQYHIYGIREVNTKGWNWDINKSEETNNGTINYQLNWNEYVSSVKNASYKIDKTAPDGDAYIGYSSILNNKVYKWFFKNSVFVGINSWDVAGRNNTVSGIAKVEYKLLGDEEFTTYNPFWGIKIDANTKTDVLVKITDKAGNEKVLSNSDDIIVYTDAQADTESVDYVKTSMEEKTVFVKVNDNTIKAVQNVTTGEKLTEEDYSVSGNNEIILSGEYLDKLAAKDDSSDSREAEVYKFVVSYNPYGEKFTAYNPYATYYDFWRKEWVNNTDSLGFDANPTFFKVNVYKANEELTLTIADKTYDGQPIAFEVTNESGRDITGNDEESFAIFFAPIEAKGSEGEISEDAWTDVTPKDAGIYRARFVAMEDGNYYRAETFADFRISKRTVTIDIPDYTKYEDEPDPAFTVSFGNTVPGEGVRGFAWRNNSADNTPGVKSISYRVDGAYPNYDFVNGDMGSLTILARETTTIIPVLTTGGGGGGAVTTVVEEEEITEIEEEEVPEIEVPEVEETVEEAPVVEIPEEEVPEAVAERCIIHWLALADALLYAIYSIFRALQNKEELSDEAESAKN